ncbi:hypothetical protein [Arthrobacter sp. UYCu723]
MSFNHGYADNHGLRVYYEAHGRAVPGQPPLLFIPGGGSTIGTNFGELIPLRAEQRHGDYLGEQAASGGDLRTMHATVPFLLRFLGE